MIEAEMEILELENAKLQEGTLEKLFVELRLDMKKDNIKMMSKIDSVSTVAGDLRANIKKIQEENREFNTGLKFTQDLQMDEKVRTDK